MRILKYKKMSNGKYKLELDNGNSLLLYEEVILKYNLLITKDIDLNNDCINIYNLECDCYYVALKSLNNRFKSVKELKNSLIKKEYPLDMVEKVISKLLKQGYLNDRSFSKSFINNQMITTNNGPEKIMFELVKKGVSKDIVDSEIGTFTLDEQVLKINKLINKMIKSNRTRGGIVLRKKICSYLINLGYDISLINKCLDNFSFSNDIEISKREYEKLYKRLSRKYTGKELEYKIAEKMYQKGLHYEK